MVGLLSVGTQYIAFANANGQRNWCSFDDVILDWSIYTGPDKACKAQWATQAWVQQPFINAFDKTIAEAELLKQPAKAIKRGQYRVYLAPTALADIITFTDFGYKRWHNKSNRLQRWFDGRETLSQKLTLKQNTALGLAANFQQQGYVNQSLDLIVQGQPAGKLISPRSGIEFGVTHNGADNGESFTSLEVAAGDLAEENILSQLNTGIYINNLHYLNVSDLSAARLTGMTRFACFWVENGKKISPINVMRFDDSLYRLLGSELEALTVQRERIVSDSTYFHRGRGGMLLPGALSSMTFTL
jgi:predicted Zn-dependent protease